MELNLTLTGLELKDRIPFCIYIIEQLNDIFESCYDTRKASKLEEFINKNKVIKWQIPIEKYISVYNIYKLVFNYLYIKTLDNNTFTISFDRNINIPQAYTKLYNIVSLLEFGNLSVHRYGLLNRCMKTIVDNLKLYYSKYMLEAR